MYTDRPSLVHYICRHSTKLAYVAWMVHKIYIVNRRKVILFCDWPATSWLVEILIMLVGFNVLSIRAKHNAAEWEAAVSTFNDKENPVQVLVTSLKVSSTSLNLQKDCADIIFVDVSSNA